MITFEICLLVYIVSIFTCDFIYKWIWKNTNFKNKIPEEFEGFSTELLNKVVPYIPFYNTWFSLKWSWYFIKAGFSVEKFKNEFNKEE